MRKSSGEMLRVAVKPPQPEQRSGMTATASKSRFCVLLNIIKPHTIVRIPALATPISDYTAFLLVFASADNILISPMFSTIYCPGNRCPGLWLWMRRLGWVAALAVGVSAQAQVAPADPKPPGDAQFAKQAEKAFDEAKSRYDAESNNIQASLGLARTSYDWADYVTTDAKRAKIAETGMAASRRALQTDSNNVGGHYYLAMNMGQLARTKSLGALKIVTQMEAEFNVVLGLDSKFDHAGADRNLGLLYLDSPGWPLSIGNKGKAREHLEKAVKLSFNYPENQLNLIEANLKWGDKKAATAGLKTLAAIWAAARDEFRGETWESSWADWAKRRAAAEKKAGVKPEDNGAVK